MYVRVLGDDGRLKITTYCGGSSILNTADVFMTCKNIQRYFRNEEIVLALIGYEYLLRIILCSY